MGGEGDEGLRRLPWGRNEIDVAGIGRAIRRRKLSVILPVLLCFAAAWVAVTVIKPRYTAEAKILIENGETFFTRPDRDERAADLLPDDEAVQSQVQLVSSRDLARRAIKQLGLEGNPEFDPLADGMGRVSRLLVLLGLERDPLRTPAEDRILSSFADKLSVYPVQKSRVLTLQFTSLDPDLAARAANVVSDLYIGLQSGAKRDSARAAAASLAGLIADLRVKAADADAKVQDYRAENGLLLGTNNTTITSQQLSDVTTQLAQARTAEADADAKAKLLREMIKANRVDEVPDVANNDLIRRVAEQRMLVKTQIAQSAQTLLPGHPRMQELNAQLGDIDAQMRAAAEKVVRTLENDAKIAAGRVDNLSVALDAQKKTAGTAGTDEVKLNTLELQARLLKDQLEFSTQKYQEAVARENADATPADARVISRAAAPSMPSFPRKIPTIAILTLAGLVFSVGMVIARELLSGRAFMPEVGPESLPIQLAREPLEGEPRAVAGLTAGPLSPERPGLSPDLATVLAALESRDAERGVRTLVTAAAAGGTLSTAALRIARTLVGAHRVILVDCGADGLDAALGPDANESRPGLLNLLSGTTTFAEVIHRDPGSRLHVVALGTGRPEAGAQAFAMVADALAETYDHVVFASALPSGHDLPVAEHADLAVLVEAPTSSPEGTAACRAALGAAGVEEVVVLPCTDPVAEKARAA